MRRRAMALLQERPGMGTPEVSAGLEDYAQMLRKMKRKKEAQEIELQKKALFPR